MMPPLPMETFSGNAYSERRESRTSISSSRTTSSSGRADAGEAEAAGAAVVWAARLAAMARVARTGKGRRERVDMVDGATPVADLRRRAKGPWCQSGKAGCLPVLAQNLRAVAKRRRFAGNTGCP